MLLLPHHAPSPGAGASTLSCFGTSCTFLVTSTSPLGPRLWLTVRLCPGGGGLTADCTVLYCLAGALGYSSGYRPPTHHPIHTGLRCLRPAVQYIAGELPVDEGLVLPLVASHNTVGAWLAGCEAHAGLVVG